MNKVNKDMKAPQDEQAKACSHPKKASFLTKIPGYSYLPNRPAPKMCVDIAMFAGATFVIVKYGKWIASSLDEMIPSEK